MSAFPGAPQTHQQFVSCEPRSDTMIMFSPHHTAQQQGSTVDPSATYIHTQSCSGDMTLDSSGTYWMTDRNRTQSIYPFTPMSHFMKYNNDSAFDQTTVVAPSWTQPALDASTPTLLPAHTFSFRHDLSVHSSIDSLTDVDWQSVTGTTQSLAPDAEVCASPTSFSCSSRPSAISTPYSRTDHSICSIARQYSPMVKIEEGNDSGQAIYSETWEALTFDQSSNVRPDDVMIVSACEPSQISEDLSVHGFGSIDSTLLEDSKPLVQYAPPVSQPTSLPSRFPFGAYLNARKKRTLTKAENATCSCHICDRPFQRAYNLKAHLLTHDPTREQPHSCGISGCLRRFVRRTDLLRHRESVHIKSRNHACMLCSATFSRRDTLRRHVEDGCARRPEVKRRLFKQRGLPTMLDQKFDQ